ncbi:uncharacterized protein SPSK_09650 [Sporothrix schenckii 1099-18]|uniref:Uncharacterized protein n=2 Tax=Sporothrix schenckii TaxID=29908 RepID=U7Q8K0_SPOS1|nr:uncharacterized protein SPSK_09650 [Sporothrix schenckii 1099-18]ERT03086.1 hypothetical protein HMPREF1624_01391 [Sporothrix schenckii ATCC 58251]KJR84511.1 hypothetical protein SPSK_09650 [Sporothrix schenckii 1099-18]
MKWSSSLSALLASTAAFVSASPVASRELKLYNLKIVAPLASNLNGRYLSINPDGSVGIYSNHPVDTGGVPPSAPVPPSASSSPASGQAQPPPAAKFYVTQSGPTGSPAASYYELHTYPIGIVDHALGLNGSATAGLRHLVDVVNPGAAGAGTGGDNAPDWKSFTLDNFDTLAGGDDKGDDNGAEGRAEIDIAKRIPPPLPLNGFSYGGSDHGKWLVFPRGSNTFVVAWYDGTSIITQNYRSVDIIYEPTTA